MLSSIISLLPLLALAPPVLAHFHGTDAELASRAHAESHIRRAYASNCHEKLAKRGLHAENAQRRAKFAAAARNEVLVAKRSVMGKRQVATYNETHLAEGTYNTTSDPFETDLSGCVLQPDVTQGPYCE
jgi:hypothetical protein